MAQKGASLQQTTMLYSLGFRTNHRYKNQCEPQTIAIALHFFSPNNPSAAFCEKGTNRSHFFFSRFLCTVPAARTLYCYTTATGAFLIIYTLTLPKQCAQVLWRSGAQCAGSAGGHLLSQL